MESVEMMNKMDWEPSIRKLAREFIAMTPPYSDRLRLSIPSVDEGKPLEAHREHHLYKSAKRGVDGLFHCPWEGQETCDHKPETLECNYDKYVDAHLKPYRCRFDVCENARFSSTATLLRHKHEAHGMHGHGDKPYLCTYKSCERSHAGNGFPRKWKLRDHMRRVHNDSDLNLPSPNSHDRGSGESVEDNGLFLFNSPTSIKRSAFDVNDQPFEGDVTSMEESDRDHGDSIRERKKKRMPFRLSDRSFKRMDSPFVSASGHSTVASDVYDPDEVLPLSSPLMKPYRPKLKSSPSPPEIVLPLASQSSSLGKESVDRRREIQPTHGDAILIFHLDNGKHPDITREALADLSDSSEEEEDSGSESDCTPDESESEGGIRNNDKPPELITRFSKLTTETSSIDAISDVDASVTDREHLSSNTRVLASSEADVEISEIGAAKNSLQVKDNSSRTPHSDSHISSTGNALTTSNDQEVDFEIENNSSALSPGELTNLSNPKSLGNREERNLPHGQCRYILLDPAIKGQRCACVGFTLDRDLPGVSCQCGHQSCFHLESSTQSNAAQKEVGSSTESTTAEKKMEGSRWHKRRWRVPGGTKGGEGPATAPKKVEGPRRRIQLWEGQLNRENQAGLGGAPNQVVQRIGDSEEQFEMNRGEMDEEMQKTHDDLSRLRGDSEKLADLAGLENDLRDNVETGSWSHPRLRNYDQGLIVDAASTTHQSQSHTGSDGINDSRTDHEWHVTGLVNGFETEALADTGANINAISKSEADRIGMVPEHKSAGRTIRLPSGETCRSLGTANVRFNFDGEDAVHHLRCTIVDRLEYSMIVCYTFLQKTETLTRFFKKRIKEVARTCLRRFPLCLLEDVSMSNDTRARMNGLINGKSATVVPDTGSGIMAVSAKYAKRLGLQVDTTRRTKVVFADGSSATTSGIVKATWNFIPPDPNTELRACLDDGGQATNEKVSKRLVTSPDTDTINETENQGDAWDYDWEYEWHVIEDLPVEAILSLNFIRRHDIFAKHQHAFVVTAPRLTLADIFGIRELPGGSKELKSLAGEFVCDLNSPNPFTHDMIVRESARRSEIRRRIDELDRNVHSTQLVLEQARIKLWQDIAAAKENGEDWSRLRSDYLHSLCLQPAQLSWPQNSTSTSVLSQRANVKKKRGLGRWQFWIS